jgi:hypothetical protein
VTLVVLFQTFQDIRNQTNSIKKTMDTREYSVSASSSALMLMLLSLEATSSFGSLPYELFPEFRNVTGLFS